MLQSRPVPIIVQLLSVLACALFAPALTAQAVNPLVDDPRAASAGQTLFRAQCATCHGADAKGIDTIDAPDLTLLWQRDGVTDATVFGIIRRGIPGTIMPPHGFPDAEIWMLVSYLHSVDASANEPLPAGDADAGRRLFTALCAECHRAGGPEGGSLGPDLARLVARRSLESLLLAVREPSAAIGRGYKPVSLITAANERVQGVVKSEDAFTIQILDSRQQLRAFDKRDLRDLTREQTSLMPVFSESTLSDQQFIDIVNFLQ